MPYRIRAVAAEALRTFVVRRNFLRFTSCGAGSYCKDISIAGDLISAKIDRWCLQLNLPFCGLVAEYARRQPQTEMPNRASFLELNAACPSRFGDSGVIEAGRLVSTGSMSINGHKFKR
ncbi:hypothetical protein [Bradyrhizobium liaoningense]|uniref:hypothetical protein n=1 Tax=Bradyrhizobium liaoningense TaxID=43992 RepID=UPI001BAE232F|nr:hypothetical protein [Bradyrhizobium liaoningense]MBR0854464.1 hypothetical protein [Bradyrhizobium liaoningense]